MWATVTRPPSLLPVAAPAPSAPPIPGGPGERHRQEVLLALRLLLTLTAAPPPDGGVVVAAYAATQEGLASKLAVTQGAVSKVLRQLRAAGVIRRDKGHVAGFSRRVGLYSLTPRGTALVQTYRARFGAVDPPPLGAERTRAPPSAGNDPAAKPSGGLSTPTRRT